MHVEITTRHCTLSDDLKQRVESRLEKLTRFDEQVSDARVVVTQEGIRFSAEAIVSANGLRMVSHAEEDSDKSALAAVLDRAEAQVRRHRDRVTKKRKKSSAMGEVMAPTAPPEEAATAPTEEYRAFGDAEDYEGLVSEDAGDLAVEMELAEAVAMLRASRREVLGFTNSDTGHATLVFKRRDGNVGMTEIDRS